MARSTSSTWSTSRRNRRGGEGRKAAKASKAAARLRARAAGGPLRYRYDASGHRAQLPQARYKALVANPHRVALGTAGGFELRAPSPRGPPSGCALIGSSAVPLRVITAGESHGPGLTCIVEGLPAGLELDREPIDRDMARRQLGHGRGGRMKIEKRRRRGHRRASATAARSAARSRCRSPTATTPTGRSG